MKIIYMVYNDWTIKQKAALHAVGIEVEVGFNRIDIEENEKNASALKLIDSWEGVKKFYGTMYDKNDINKASLLVYVGVWPNGYPMPDNDGGYQALTYNLDDYCTLCGIGEKQKSPFRLKKAPNWGNKLMFELN